MPDANGRLSGDEYMDLLQQRMDEWLAANSATMNPKYPPLFQWFVRDGDEDLVDPALLAAPEPKPKPVRQPRYYRPASYWREQVERIEAQRAALAEPLVTDRAAAGGCALGPKRTARVQKLEDGRLRRYAALEPKLLRAQHMLRAAVAREARAADQAA